MRISDWSSDVCSSDLRTGRHFARGAIGQTDLQQFTHCVSSVSFDAPMAQWGARLKSGAHFPSVRSYRFWRIAFDVITETRQGRSDERRVGKESDSTGGSRGGTEH